MLPTRGAQAGTEKSPQWIYSITVYTLNCAIHVANVDWLRAAQTFIGPDTVAYETPIDRSVDIDTDRDLEYAEFLLAGSHRRPSHG